MGIGCHGAAKLVNGLKVAHLSRSKVTSLISRGVNTKVHGYQLAEPLPPRRKPTCLGDGHSILQPHSCVAPERSSPEIDADSGGCKTPISRRD